MPSDPSPTTRQKITRRTALAGLGLGTVALLPGCRAAVHEYRSDDARASTPQRGGTLRAAIHDDLVPANLFTNSTSGVTALIGLVYESLIRYPNDRVRPQPRLATSWRQSADGRSISLQLRRDVRFHSGRPFTSQDVAFSIATYAQDKWNGQLKSSAKLVTRVDTSDPYVAVLHLAKPLSNIFDLLDTVFIVDHESVDDLATGARYVGTGPFRFESWTPNSELVFRRNEHYWRPDRPYLDGVHVAVVPDSNTLVLQMRSGQIDFAEGLNYRDAERLGKDPRYQAIQLNGAEQQIYVGANVTATPLDDVRVRQAIAYAIDRDRIVSEVFRGAGYPVNLPWPKYSAAYDSERNRRYAYDPHRARTLVDEIGGKLPTIPYTYNTALPAYAATAQIVQSNLRDVGIDVSLEPLDQAQFVKLLIGAQFKGLWTTFHSRAHYEPSTLSVSAYPFNARHNASRFRSPDYTAHAEGIWTTPLDRVRKDDYSALSDDLLDELFLIEIGVIYFVWVASTRLAGVSYTKRWELDLTNAYLG